ncbi:hypothetical protein E4U43_007353, partial [Claviceps pusilla]
MAHMPPKAKKLPFKPTALGKTASRLAGAGGASADTKKEQYGDDGLDLFRRSKEMQPIMEAERERRLLRKQRKQKQKQKQEEEEEEQRRKAAATAGKRPWDSGGDEYNEAESSDLAARVTPQGSQSTEEAFRSTTPINVDLGGFGEEV